MFRVVSAAARAHRRGSAAPLLRQLHRDRPATPAGLHARHADLAREPRLGREARIFRAGAGGGQPRRGRAGRGDSRRCPVRGVADRRVRDDRPARRRLPPVLADVRRAGGALSRRSDRDVRPDLGRHGLRLHARLRRGGGGHRQGRRGHGDPSLDLVHGRDRRPAPERTAGGRGDRAGRRGVRSRGVVLHDQLRSSDPLRRGDRARRPVAGSAVRHPRERQCRRPLRAGAAARPARPAARPARGVERAGRPPGAAARATGRRCSAISTSAARPARLAAAVGADASRPGHRHRRPAAATCTGPDAVYRRCAPRTAASSSRSPAATSPATSTCRPVTELLADLAGYTLQAGARRGRGRAARRRRAVPARDHRDGQDRLAGAELRLRRRRRVRRRAGRRRRPVDAALRHGDQAGRRDDADLPAGRLGGRRQPASGGQGRRRWSARSPATQAYYERWASTWEFQALLKARPVAGDLELGRALPRRRSRRSSGRRPSGRTSSPTCGPCGAGSSSTSRPRVGDREHQARAGRAARRRVRRPAAAARARPRRRVAAGRAGRCRRSTRCATAATSAATTP